jgi:hypothetical protein
MFISPRDTQLSFHLVHGLTQNYINKLCTLEHSHIMDNSDEEKTGKNKWFQYQTNDPNGWIFFQ